MTESNNKITGIPQYDKAKQNSFIHYNNHRL